MIETTLHDDVLEIVIANPPVNALGHAVRAEIAAAVLKAQSDAAVRAIVLRGDGALFSGGADITEFDGPGDGLVADATMETIEASQKPVLAAIEGVALGGGLELALACHFRMATPKARLGLPEVTLGLLPGLGGTQRLPRLIGVAASLDMIVLGAPVSGTKAMELGLVDALARQEALAADAIAYARTLSAPRRVSLGGVLADESAFEAFQARSASKIKGLEAAKACIEAIRAATQTPFAEGLRKEQALFGQLAMGEQSRALRHIFLAERAAAKIDGLPKDAARRPIKAVGVIGAGTMGGGIAMNFLSAGLPVTLVETTQEALDRGVAAIRGHYEASLAKGRLTREEVERFMSLLTPTLDVSALAGPDLVVEAVYENMDLKKEIFARLDQIARPGAILASNTSYLSIDEMAAVTGRPQDVLGLHFFSPANVMKLVEVVRGARTAPEALATAMDVARRIGKTPVVAGVCYGFIGNRMLLPRQINAEALLLEGATPDQVDRVHVAFGMPMGPFQMADLAGVDLGWHRDPTRIDTLQDALCAQGRWGQKTRAGFYDYDDRRRPAPAPVVERIIEDLRAKAGIAPRAISDDEIIARTFYTMINEGAKILDEGIAQRASDIDVVWTHGYGWPRHRGGPMFWADQVGLGAIVEGLKLYTERLGEDFVLSPLLERCAAQGQRLERKG